MPRSAAWMAFSTSRRVESAANLLALPAAERGLEGLEDAEHHRRDPRDVEAGLLRDGLRVDGRLRDLAREHLVDLALDACEARVGVGLAALHLLVEGLREPPKLPGRDVFRRHGLLHLPYPKSCFIAAATTRPISAFAAPSCAATDVRSGSRALSLTVGISLNSGALLPSARRPKTMFLRVNDPTNPNAPGADM